MSDEMGDYMHKILIDAIIRAVANLEDHGGFPTYAKVFDLVLDTNNLLPVQQYYKDALALAVRHKLVFFNGDSKLFTVKPPTPRTIDSEWQP